MRRRIPPLLVTFLILVQSTFAGVIRYVVLFREKGNATERERC